MDWSHACSVQSGRKDLESALYGSISLPLILFALLAVYSGGWLWKWMKDTEEMSQTWPILNRFCSLTLVCGLSGASASAFTMKYRLTPLNENPYIWLGTLSILSSIEFLSSTVARLILLHQLMTDAPRSSLATAFPRFSRALPLLMKIVAAVACICCVTEFVATCKLANDAFYRSDDRSSRIPYVVAYSSRSVSSVVVAAAFVLIGAWSIASSLRAESKGKQGLLTASKLPPAVALLHLTSASTGGGMTFLERNSTANTTTMAMAVVRNSIDASRDQRRRLLPTCLYITVAFTLNAAWSVIVAYTVSSEKYVCGDFCDPCQSQEFLIYYALYYTPELENVIYALSSPMPLLLSLWFITAARLRARSIAREMKRTCEEVFGVRKQMPGGGAL